MLRTLSMPARRKREGGSTCFTRVMPSAHPKLRVHLHALAVYISSLSTSFDLKSLFPQIRAVAERSKNRGSMLIKLLAALRRREGADAAVKAAKVRRVMHRSVIQTACLSSVCAFEPVLVLVPIDFAAR